METRSWGCENAGLLLRAAEAVKRPGRIPRGRRPGATAAGSGDNASMDEPGTDVRAAPRVVVREEHDGRVARLVLSNPPDNAVDVTLADELFRTLDALERWPALACVVLEGEGSHFSSGLALGHRRPPYGDELVRSFLAAARKLAALEVVQLACVRGRCFGAGFELALLTHFILADHTAKFALPDASLGALPLLGPLLLPARVGTTRAEEWLFTGRTIEADEAVATGLVTACAHGWDTLETLTNRHLAQAVLGRPTGALKAMARALSLPRIERLERDLPELERLFRERIALSPDYGEGLSAALRGRAPRWNQS